MKKIFVAQKREKIKTSQVSNKSNKYYSDNQTTVESEDDIQVILKWIWCYYKAIGLQVSCWNGYVYTAKLLCLMFIELFKDII